METYLVGGAVRDRLLGKPVKERDYVVVGSSTEEMKSLGYEPVGRDFPVFLHPKTKQEYALARTERKKGKGHTGFECETDAVTLDQDLLRRDLTINAIAEDESGELIDPWGGLDDLEARTLRHVSPAFSEDPLRVLRVARFAALLAGEGFTVHPDTLAVMRGIVRSGELTELAPERVFMELDKALATDAPNVFFKVLSEVGADEVLWPELDSDGISILADVASQLSEPEQRFAVLASTLDDASREQVAVRSRLPNSYARLAALVRLLVPDWHRLPELSATDIMAVFQKADAIRQPERFQSASHVMHALALAKNPGGSDQLAAIEKSWQRLLDRALAVSADDVTSDASGPALGEAIRKARIAAIDSAR